MLGSMLGISYGVITKMSILSQRHSINTTLSFKGRSTPILTNLVGSFLSWTNLKSPYSTNKPYLHERLGRMFRGLITFLLFMLLRSSLTPRDPFG